MNRNKLPAILVALLLAIALLCTSCAKSVSPPEAQETYPIHTELQAAYLSALVDDVSPYADGTEEKSRPLPVTIDFSDISDDYIKAEFSEDVSFEDALTVDIREKKAEIYNLKVGTKYYVRAKTSEGKTGEIRAFLTEDACPRNLYISGVTNARDLGGYTTPNGKIRQGLLYRTGRLNHNKTETPEPSITEAGIRTMVDDLKIKTEVDLRKSSNNEIGGLTASVLGESVSYHNLPMSYDLDMLSANDDSLCELFRLLSDESNYPLFFHCSIGTDRTGYSAFLMLTVLGASQEDIYRDYMFSNFGAIGSDRTILNVMGFALYIALQEGATQQRKAENYLLSIGVKQEEIDAFRRIMIE